MIWDWSDFSIKFLLFLNSHICFSFRITLNHFWKVHKEKYMNWFNFSQGDKHWNQAKPLYILLLIDSFRVINKVNEQFFCSLAYLNFYIYIYNSSSKETQTEHTIILPIYQKTSSKNHETYHPCADLIALQPLPSHQLKEEKKIPPNWQTAMVAKQPTQTAGNRPGDPIGGGCEKEGVDQRQEEVEVMVHGLTPAHVWPTEGWGVGCSFPLSPLRYNACKQILQRTVCQDHVLFLNLFITCHYQHLMKVTVTIVMSSLWVWAWEPVSTSCTRKIYNNIANSLYYIWNNR